MPLPLGLAEGDKFAILAIKNIGTEALGSQVLPDSTSVAPGLPVDIIDEFWQQSLGTIAIQDLRRCNLLLLRRAPSENPRLLDAEHEALAMRTLEVFWLLQLSGVPYYEGAVILKGSVVDGRIEVRAHDNLSGHQFVASNGAPNARITGDGLRRAAESAEVWRGMLANPGDHARIKRGLNVLLEGLQEHFGQERLHAFVRALEALILPRIGETRRQFAARCQTFAVAAVASQACLEDCFDMRSVVEHMNDSTTCLSAYPVDEREVIALRRVRQIEALARFAYERLLSTPDLRRHFTSDATIADFWRLPSEQRQPLWGSQFDINAVA